MGLIDFWFGKKTRHASDSLESKENAPLSSKTIVYKEPKPLNFTKENIKYFYEHPETLVDFEFSNRTDIIKNIWVEPTCVSIELEKSTEYKIVTHDRFLRMEFDEDNQMVFYLQYSFGFKLYKRPVSQEIINKNVWILDLDYSDIN